MTAIPTPHPWIAGMLGACALLASTDAQAQLDHNTQAPSLEHASPQRGHGSISDDAVQRS